jgi:hypothetical protein
MLCRFFVLHSAGYLDYYKQAWAPGSNLKPLKRLLIKEAIGITQAEAVEAKLGWPDEVGTGLRFGISYPTFSMACYADNLSATSQWVAALSRLVGDGAEREAIPAPVGVDDDKGRQWARSRWHKVV